jgi:SOS-response transcriptional repressor LexA
MMATGELKLVNKKQGRWGESCVMEAQDNILALEGINRGDYLVVQRSSTVPADDALVVLAAGGESTLQPLNAKGGSRYKKQPRLVLRQMEHFGAKIRLQPGNSPRSLPYITPESAGIWGVVVAVMRKFQAA